MKTSGGLKVFLAHGFSTSRDGRRYSEMEVARKFERLLKHHGFRVLKGDHPEVEDIDKKIKKRIDESDVVLGLFTRRWRVLPAKIRKFSAKSTAKAPQYIAPPFVLSECSYALGAHQSLEAPKLVGGFAEEGIEIKDLALVTAGGREILWFDLQTLESRECQSRIAKYIESIPERLGRKRIGEDLFEPPPYRQLAVRKVVTVYRNGLAITKNRYKILIPDPDTFAETGGKILHFLYSDQPITLPSFKRMMSTPIEKRFNSPFFAVTAFSENNKPFDGQIKVTPNKQSAQEIAFFVELGQPTKPNTTIEYEYAWGIPNHFATSARAMRGEGHNSVSLRAFHGRISEAELEVNFERGLKGTEKHSIFAVPPFYQLASQASLDSKLFGRHNPLTKADQSIWDETYKWRHVDFHGAVRISWRPL